MSRRGRAIAFLMLAALAAVTAAAVAQRYRASAKDAYGPLRPVVVAATELPAGRAIGPREARALAVRRLPARFAPAGALVSPREALGLVPQAALPPGAYLLAAQLRPPRRGGERRRRLGEGRRPVEISVAGAGALLTAHPGASGGRVDVVVTTEPRGPGPGRTYVAATAVPLLALRREPGGMAAATLGLTRRQALRLIAAESFARRVTLLPGA